MTWYPILSVGRKCRTKSLQKFQFAKDIKIERKRERDDFAINFAKFLLQSKQKLRSGCFLIEIVSVSGQSYKRAITISYDSRIVSKAILWPLARL